MNKVLAFRAMLLVATLSIPLMARAEQTVGNVADNATPQVRQEVLQAVDEWREAVINKDRVALERAYHDELSYGHTDGAVLTKREQIDRTIVPDRDFTQVELTDIAVRTQGNVALVTGGFAFHIKQGEESRVARLSGLDVWLKGPQGWQLIARQLTRPAQ